MNYPDDCKTDSDKIDYLYRFCEKLKEKHNAASNSFDRGVCLEQIKEVATELSIVKERHTPTNEQEMIEAQEKKEAAVSSTKWDKDINLG